MGTYDSSQLISQQIETRVQAKLLFTVEGGGVFIKHFHELPE